MRKHCSKGLPLCKHFERLLKVWGFAIADVQGAEIIPLGPAKKRIISRIAKEAESSFIQARHAYVEHMTDCIVCSRHLVRL